MHVVLVGNVVSGISVFGPFKTGVDAVEWASENLPADEEYVLAPLRAPEACAE